MSKPRKYEVSGTDDPGDVHALRRATKSARKRCSASWRSIWKTWN